MRDLITALPAQVYANLRRVSATGGSNGASMTGVLGCGLEASVWNAVRHAVR